MTVKGTRYEGPLFIPARNPWYLFPVRLRCDSFTCYHNKTAFLSSDHRFLKQIGESALVWFPGAMKPGVYGIVDPEFLFEIGQLAVSRGGSTRIIREGLLKIFYNNYLRSFLYYTAVVRVFQKKNGFFRVGDGPSQMAPASCVPFCSFTEWFHSTFPDKSTIRGWFVLNFEKSKPIYDACLGGYFGKILSFDHSQMSPLKGGKAGAHQYASIVNKISIVIAHVLVGSIALKKVKQMFRDLAERLQRARALYKKQRDRQRQLEGRVSARRGEGEREEDAEMNGGEAEVPPVNPFSVLGGEGPEGGVDIEMNGGEAELPPVNLFSVSRGGGPEGGVDVEMNREEDKSIPNGLQHQNSLQNYHIYQIFLGTKQ
uniref:Uncharacterized protein n=1 Tax=Chromera velia CCMP2878 TaxID=1169474 RepID=A0A0G4HDX8_9ALVE|eukprot:Cvel_26595.t1-p1 / transcript=Cvel_26595.t1 / gene=Cvel_26595 / organism=Chromera_velia_CCMP2878 / gene_product=hypothetical protein / transcript_product=hypothetical protein / location=Cvel_scaffold3187:10629-11735(-) / protein_length=369 / sequence_SO=supercontig / SO=protein_coding / is_pseudo=false